MVGCEEVVQIEVFGTDCLYYDGGVWQGVGESGEHTR